MLLYIDIHHCGFFVPNDRRNAPHCWNLTGWVVRGNALLVITSLVPILCVLDFEYAYLASFSVMQVGFG